MLLNEWIEVFMYLMWFFSTFALSAQDHEALRTLQRF